MRKIAISLKNLGINNYIFACKTSAFLKVYFPKIVIIKQINIWIIIKLISLSYKNIFLTTNVTKNSNSPLNIYKLSINYNK